jgi:FkbM family methyltransferase
VRHTARSFASLPGPHQAQTLLAEIATAPCAFAPASPKAPLALYGAGELGHLAHEFLNAVGHADVMIVDRNARRLALNGDWAGIEVLEPDQVPTSIKSDLRLAVSLVTSPYVPIEQTLSDLGFCDIVPFYDLAESFRHQHPLSNGWFAPVFSQEDQHHTAQVLSRWDDDKSRAHHLQFLAWRRLREEWSFEPAPLVPSDRYFIPEVTSVLRNDEILIDGGAHYGHVTKAFVRKINGAFEQIVAIEPDSTNRALLQDNLKSWLPDDQRVTVYDCALADSDGEALFHGELGYASQLSDTGRERVAVRSLDGIRLSPTFVKLHLEGGELLALNGARETLSSSRPIIATTVYHNADGVWRTALWLMETLPDYRFLFRLDSWCGTGALIYAIPNERSRTS